ncbi:MocR-like pyridoxine biosynthesis transcription factor PdxR [Deinococcus cellulosilyticus]|uniref:GntR family transcriptional regulator n=1 Tax=Deinococcus cellulosilyticus (strain DSM 18568 / NBRC 106333 / KACC 11606 / 5516J-15) TaxID=1223518 RepID=A0A511NA59_DEIC1|nr:PLP-dependent aminotransferase family protein [Deinococcus cellulosilyticus]GEM49715.1 GntR family transcriptional regulator [Deinococcus cellulosilyticus NBRC 106333 = KACC 11606]
MLPPLNPSPSEPLYRQVYQALREAILAGALPEGSKLPSSREFAKTWGVARNTVLEAFELLEVEGFIETRPASGTYVAHSVNPEVTLDVPAPGLKLTEWAIRALQTPLRPAYDQIEVDFRLGNVPNEFFPAEAWARALRERAKALQGGMGQYGDELGPLETREAISSYLARERGVKATAGMVMLSSGSQGSLDALARVFLEPGKTVVMEDPGYLGARRVFEASGAEVLYLPVDDEGLNPELLPRKADLLYVTPAHQFPTGAILPASRRLRILDWARSVGAWIVEDDYNSEFRFDTRPLSAMQGLNPSQVIYVGTFSKSLSPALRSGFLVAPAPIIEVLSATRYLTDRQPPTLDSLALADFLHSGGFARHLKKTRATILERYETLLSALRKHFPEFTIPTTGAGLHICAFLPESWSEEHLRAASLHSKVAVDFLSRYATRVVQSGIILNYAHLAPQAIEKGIRQLREAL